MSSWSMEYIDNISGSGDESDRLLMRTAEFDQSSLRRVTNC